MLREVPKLASLYEDGHVDQAALLARSAAHLETAALHQIREVDASSAPDVYNIAQKQEIRRKRRRRVQFEAL